MLNLDWHTIGPFSLGAATAIVLSIIANLLTPNRGWLLNWVQSWWANRSVKNATKEINNLKTYLNLVESIASSPDQMIRYVARLIFYLFALVCVAGVTTVVIRIEVFADLWLIELLLFLLGLIVAISGLSTIDKADNVDKYRNDVDVQIKNLEATIQRLQAAKHPSDPPGTMKWG
jgi:hypothetical protein